MKRQRELALGGIAAILGVFALLLPADRAHAQLAGTDLIAEALEVTQGVQDLENTVALVADKRTYVRFYARASEGFHYPTARLFVRRPGVVGDTLLRPLNPGQQALVFASRPLGLAAARGWGDGGFLFELPSHFTRGTLEFTAVVESDDAETDLANNVLTRTVSFDDVVPNPELTIRLLSYTVGVTRTTPAGEATQVVDWLRRAYPVSGVDFSLQFTTWVGPTSTVRDPRSGVLLLTRPNCGDLNQAIAVIEGLDLGATRGPLVTRTFSPVRSLALVHDRGAFMRGCTAGIPGPIASGPTGSATWGWDLDGSYGDWYAGHELAHTYGRFHAEFCDAGGGADYPYPFGRISPPNPIRSRIYGFDISTRDVYSHLWKDNMTYCPRQWMSDFTYEGILGFLKAAAGAAGGGELTEPAQTGRLLSVVGSIDPSQDEAALQPAFQVESAGQPPISADGSHVIVLRDGDGGELARYPFTPLEEQSGPPAPGSDPGESGELRRLLVSQLVPFVAGTRRIDLEGPGGKLLASRRPGAAPPEVEVVSPQGQESFDGKPVLVSWEATDPDGDPLTFVVQYRADAGKPWRSVALPTTETSIEIPFENLPSGERARFRVLASDGLNTAVAESSVPFEVANRPPSLELVSPKGGDVFVKGQSIALEAVAYDSDVGGLDGGSLRWHSSRDGALGTGPQLTVASLSEGTHVIEVVAEDGAGNQNGTASSEIQIEVVGEVDQLPKMPDRLVAGPSEILLAPAGGARRAPLVIHERNQGAVRWTASVDQPWLELSSTSGTTPAALEVSLRSGKPRPEREATIRIESQDLNTAPVEIHVEVDWPGRR